MQFPEPLYRGRSKDTGLWSYGFYAIDRYVRKEGRREFQEGHYIVIQTPSGIATVEVEPSSVGIFTGFTAVWEEFEEQTGHALDDKGNEVDPGPRKVKRTEERIFTGHYLKQSHSIHKGRVGWNEKGGCFAVAWEDTDKHVYWVPLHILVGTVGTQQLTQCRVSDTPFEGA